MGTAAGALTKVERAQARVVKAEADLTAFRAKRDAALREALAFRENTYLVIHGRTGIAPATITKATRRA